MSTTLYKEEMVQLFQFNINNFSIGDLDPFVTEIDNNMLVYSSYESMFHVMDLNRQNVRIGDYQQMYDLFRLF